MNFLLQINYHKIIKISEMISGTFKKQGLTQIEQDEISSPVDKRQLAQN